MNDRDDIAGKKLQNKYRKNNLEELQPSLH